jgi:hypothetical protein
MNKMHIVILSVAAVGLMFYPGFGGTFVCAQQGTPAQPITIQSPFPLAELAELLQGLYARPVTYEDALLVWRGDQEDDVATGIPRLRTRLFKVPRGLSPTDTPQLDAASVRRALAAYHQQNDGPRFDLRESKMGLHIVPAQVAGADGRLAQSVNVLDSVVAIPLASRTPTEHFMALCAALTVSSGVTIRFNFNGGFRPLEVLYLPNGRMPPQGDWSEEERQSLSFNWGAQGVSAHEALVSLLAPSSTTLSWELRCLAGAGRQDRKCFLSVVTINPRQVRSDGSISVGPPLLYDRCTNCPKLVQPPLVVKE